MRFLSFLFLSSAFVGCSSSVDERPIDDAGPSSDRVDASSDELDASVDAADAALDAGPTEGQRAQAAELAAMVAYLEANTAYPYPLDYAALVAGGEAAIFAGDGSERAFLRALYAAFVAVPQGHQGFQVPERCGESLPYQTYTRRGVCGRPHQDGIVVTYATSTNPLGLHAGDRITGFSDGAPLHATLAARPMCAASMPSAASTRGMVAATFGDLIEPGDVLDVKAPDGSTRQIAVTSALESSFLSCADPLGRETELAAYATLRPDGVGILRVPSFVDPEVPFPENPTQEELDAYRETFTAKIQAAFDSVKSAPKIIWDLRGNGGGLTLVGLEIASGFAGARADELSYCTMRTPSSRPASFESQRYAAYALQPGGRFAYGGKVAVVTDELNYSAADYFPLAVKQRTNGKLVGATTSGAFGASSMQREFDGPPGFVITVDVNRCVSADTDEPLETKGVEPHVAVDYDPADLAVGRDTLIERAITSLD